MSGTLVHGTALRCSVAVPSDRSALQSGHYALLDRRRAPESQLAGVPVRRFGDATNRDVTVAFSGTSVTVLKTLAQEGQ